MQTKFLNQEIYISPTNLLIYTNNKSNINQYKPKNKIQKIKNIKTKSQILKKTNFKKI